MGAQMDADLLHKLAAGGMKVNRADKEAFRRASKTIYDDFGTQVAGGQAMIARAFALRRRTASSR
jgi:TRAP-type C4-dicarboxylate transport system substrate-binding protein